MGSGEIYYRLVTWSHGAPYFAAGDPVSFVGHRADATLYSEKDARAIQKRLGRSRASKMRLKLEQVAATETSRRRDKLSEPLSDKARQLLMFD
jgi:hypothetical protein